MMKTQTRLVPSTQQTTAITMIPVVGSLGVVTPAQDHYIILNERKQSCAKGQHIYTQENRHMYYLDTQ